VISVHCAGSKENQRSAFDVVVQVYLYTDSIPAGCREVDIIMRYSTIIIIMTNYNKYDTNYAWLMTTKFILSNSLHETRSRCFRGSMIIFRQRYKPQLLLRYSRIWLIRSQWGPAKKCEFSKDNTITDSPRDREKVRYDCDDFELKISPS